jgi:hypothetical protein
MQSLEAMTERWFARVAESYSSETAGFLTSERDPFRNPVGHLLRENLEILLKELLDPLNPATSRAALDAIVRLRAIQDLSATQAVGFVFLLRAILRDSMRLEEAVRYDAAIDRLALQAFDVYVGCREELSQLRSAEERRASHVARIRQRPPHE